MPRTLSIEFSLKETGHQNKESTEYLKKYHIHSHELLCKSLALALHLEQYQVSVFHIQKISEGLLVSAKAKFLSQEHGDQLIADLSGTPSNEYLDNLLSECVKKLKIKHPQYVALGHIDVQWKHDTNEGGHETANSNSVEMAGNEKTQESIE